MRRFGEAIVRFRVLVVIAGLVAFGIAGAVGGGVSDSLTNGGFQDPGAESVAAGQLLESQFGADDPSVVLVVTAPAGSVDDPAVAAAGIGLTEELAAEPGVTSASSYWTLGGPASLRSLDGGRALVFATVGGTDGEVLTTSGEIADEYRGTRSGLDIAVGGTGPLFAEVQTTIEDDLVRAEAIAFPITALLLVLIFGSVVAASLPLLIGGFAIVGTFLVLQVLTGFTEVSIFALNLTTALGLGLAIDYSLFMVSRFREELASGYAPAEAVARTVQTAGRTVLFSAGTVAVSLSAMLVFDLAFLRSFGYAGIAVVALAAIGAVVLLPAILAMLGHRVDRLRVRRVSVAAEGTGIWHRIATAVMRRPIPIATARGPAACSARRPVPGCRAGTIRSPAFCHRPPMPVKPAICCAPSSMHSRHHRFQWSRMAQTREQTRWPALRQLSPLWTVLLVSTQLPVPTSQATWWPHRGRPMRGSVAAPVPTYRLCHPSNRSRPREKRSSVRSGRWTLRLRPW